MLLLSCFYDFNLTLKWLSNRDFKYFDTKTVPDQVKLLKSLKVKEGEKVWKRVYPAKRFDHARALFVSKIIYFNFPILE